MMAIFLFMFSKLFGQLLLLRLLYMLSKEHSLHTAICVEETLSTPVNSRRHLQRGSSTFTELLRIYSSTWIVATFTGSLLVN